MNIVRREVVSVGDVAGPFSKQKLVCQNSHMINSNGIWLGTDPFEYSLPLLLIQIMVITMTARAIYTLLKPFRQSMITAQVMAGLILGPSLFGRNIGYMEKFLPAQSKIVLQTVSNFGLLIHLFLLGVKVDASILRQAGNNAMLIGCMSFIVPFLFSSISYASMVYGYGEIPNDLVTSLRYVVALNSITSFAVITSLLTDLNILNSELGRLATKTSMVCDICGWIMTLISRVASRDSKIVSFYAVSCNAIFMLSIVFVIRPFVIWSTKRNPKAKSKEEIPFFMIFVVMLTTSLLSEVLGLYAAFGAFWLGIALPDGPPIGSALIHKLDTVATGLLLPAFIAIGGLRTNLFVVGEKHPWVIIVTIFLGYIGKLTGTLGPALYCQMPFSEAFSLALIMCSKGVIEVSVFIMFKDSKVVNSETFNLLILSMLFVTGITRPMIVYLYDPSKRYKAKSRRTMLHTHQRNVQLRMMVCIHNADNVPTIINLLEASNPTRYSPIAVFVLHLMDLKGRASAILVPHHHLNKLNSNSNRSDHIVRAFLHFEQQHQGSVMAQHFTAIAPYASMHDDICTMALDKKATIVIVPFHKSFAIDGNVESSMSTIRNINKNVLDKAPCSVGVLIDRGHVSNSRSIFIGPELYCIALLLLGGVDDLEALAFCRRMVEHPKVSITVVHFKHKNYDHEKDTLESQMINELKNMGISKEKFIYKEEFVRHGVDTTHVVNSLGHGYDLVMVGRHHDPESPLLLGLTEWSEFPELGIIGDLLASSDFYFSVLVVQQQPGDTDFFLDGGYELPISMRKDDDSRVYPHFSTDEEFTPIHIRT